MHELSTIQLVCLSAHAGMHPEGNADFVCAMEDVLDVYERPYNARCPVIGFDEKPCQLLGEVLRPVNPKPGRVKRVDSHYTRHGTVNLFGWVEPLTGWREVWLSERRTAIDYAQALKRISDAFPKADLIVIVP